MNRQVNAISGRLSLWPSQRTSLDIPNRITEIAPPGKGTDTAALLAAIQNEFATVTDFEREFPSLGAFPIQGFASSLWGDHLRPSALRVETSLDVDRMENYEEGWTRGASGNMGLERSGSFSL